MNKIGSQSTTFKFQVNPELEHISGKESHPVFAFPLYKIKKIFVEILKNMPIEERNVAVRIHSPQTALAFRKAFRRIDTEKHILNIKQKEQPFQNKKMPQKAVKNFFEGLVLSTDSEFLDSFGFELNLVEYPDKLFDFLMSLSDQKQLAQSLNDLIQLKYFDGQVEALLQKTNSKEELAILLAKILRESIIPEIMDYKSNRRLENDKNRKKDFTSTWKNLSQENKMKLLYLGKEDSKQLVHFLIDSKVLIPSPEDIQKQVIDLLKSEKNDFCNKIFKSTLKKVHLMLQDYHEMLYLAWKDEVMRKKKKKSHRNKRNKHQKGRRNKSIGVQSNQTNQTEYRDEFSLDIQQLVQMKINKDILDFSDSISEKANRFFQRKVEAFSRLEYLLQTYFKTEIHLFGSLACGLAVDNSDIDVAIDQTILDHFDYLPDAKKVSSALEFLASNLELRPWIKNLKVISTAAIPIINLTIDTSVKMCEEYMNQTDFLRLNKSENPGQIDVDLTIQTRDQKFGPTHLGLVSTSRLKDWLQEYEKLQEITIILKYYLTKRQLNNTYKGGLKTYSLVILIIAYIKANNFQSCGSIQNILKGLTKFYGSEFEEEQTGIDIMNKEVFYQKNKSQSSSAALQIKDPINGKVMTKSCYSFKQIKRMMLEIHEKCFTHTKFEIQCFCSGLNPKSRRLILHEVLDEYNKIFHYNNFVRVLGEESIF